MPYYCVANGIQNGIYFNWEDCKRQVLHFPNNRHKKFDDLENAKRWMEENCSETDYHVDEIRIAPITQYFQRK